MNKDNEIEKRFQQLLSANDEAKRTKRALEWKREGRKVIGVLCHYVPEELIYALGMLPLRITGTWRESTPMASHYRIANSCQFHTHVVDSFLSGEYDFLDGIVATDWDDDARRTFDILLHTGKATGFATIFHLPKGSSERECQVFHKWVLRLKTGLEEHFQAKINDDNLAQAIEVYNETRLLLMKLYELRKRESSPVSGAEALRLVTASFTMPKNEFNNELKSLFPYLERRKAPVEKLKPRLLVSSDKLFHPGYLELVEKAGAIVAMDDMDTGSRYFWGTVDTTLSDKVYALSKRYLTHTPCPRTILAWEQQIDQVIEWVKEYNIDGVLNFPQLYSLCQNFGTPHFEKRLRKADILVATVERDYSLVNTGQILTRVQAFIEMVEEKNNK